MIYDLILKGTVGYWDFDPDMVDSVLARKAGEPVHVLIDSLGGLLKDGISISSAFAAHGDVHVHFRGLNASAATIASMGAKHITMDKSGMYLVHKVANMVFEWDTLNADQLRAKADEYMKTASELEKMDLTVAKMYADRCKKEYSALLDLMREDKWLSSDEALEWGFIDEITADGGGQPVRLKASTASAMASAGIPVPDMPIDADGFFEKMEAFFKKMFKSEGAAYDDTPQYKDNHGRIENGELRIENYEPTDQQNNEITDQQTNKITDQSMTKEYPMIAIAIAQEASVFESMEDGRIALDEAQMDTLESVLSAANDYKTTTEQTLKEKEAQIAEKEAELQAQAAQLKEKDEIIARLQAEPADAPEQVKAEDKDDDSACDDPHDSFAAAIAGAREMMAEMRN